MKFSPKNDNILIRRSTTEVKTPGGIHIPEQAQESMPKGEVLAVGNGRITESGAVIPSAVKVGDIVIFGKYSGTDMKIDGEMYLLLKESEIIGVEE